MTLQPVEILQSLVRMDTTNPPGNEVICIDYIRHLLDEAGIDSTVLAKDPNRPNLIARLPGRGVAPAMVWQGHVDVVTTANQSWTRPPFSGDIVDGYLWGRGSLDMKGGVVMMLCAFLQAHAEGLQPAGDIILTIVSDEEAASDYGARFLVEQHPEQFAGAAYAIGEGGGQSQTLEGKRYYSIMVAEKQVCWMKATLRGPGGHGSSPLRGGAMAKLGRLLRALDERRLPVHITPVMQKMIAALAQLVPAPAGERIGQLLDPARTDAILDDLYTQGVRQARSLDALLHNTVSATVVHGGFKTNVIPSQVELELDGRVLPGFSADDLMAELRALVGEELELAIIRHDAGRPEVDMSLYPLLADIVRTADPEATPLPSMVGGFTDGRIFARLGIQNYGFLPLKLPSDFDGGPTVHGADERVPVAAIQFGVDALYSLLQRYGT